MLQLASRLTLNGSESMIGRQDEYERMAKCEKELWWYRCLHELALEKIKNHNSERNITILDAGCGTGGFLSVLKENGFSNSEGFDLSEDAISYASSKEGLNVQRLNIRDVDKVYSENSFDVVVSNDVLYFLSPPEQRETFNKFVRLLKPDGILLLNLPAGKLFRGTHDIAVGIGRRYSKRDVLELVKDSARVKEIIFWPFLLSPLIFIVRLFQRIKLMFGKDLNVASDVSLPPPFINNLFYHLIRFENRFLVKPWGSSIFVIVQK